LEIASIETKLRDWLGKIKLERSNIIVVSRLSRRFEEEVIAYVEGKVQADSIHLSAYHLSLDHAASLALPDQEFGDFGNLAHRRQLIFLHDVDDVSSIRQFAGAIRSSLEKEAESTVVLIMRPAAAYKVYKGSRAPLFGRVVEVEEPSLRELGIGAKEADESGFLSLYEAYSHDGFDKKGAVESPKSASFNALNLFWHFLTNDSKKTGSVRVVSSCIAYYNTPMRISEINRKCGIEYARQTVHAALKTRLMKMTDDKPKRAYIYPPLLESWIRSNIHFFPSGSAYQY